MFFPFWEWEGYINTKSQAININGITKAEREQNIYIYIYIYIEENKHLFLNEQ